MIKLCGIRRVEDIYYCNEGLPDYIGFVFAESRRQVSPALARELKAKLSPNIRVCAVTVNAPIELFADICGFTDIFQLHGDEDNEYISALRRLYPEKEIWKAARIRSERDIDILSKITADKFVLDAFSENAYGGTGKRIDEKLLYYAKTNLKKPFFIAGGVEKNNIKDIMLKFSPYGVDLSSSIETDGFKNREKMLEIMSIYRKINEKRSYK